MQIPREENLPWYTWLEGRQKTGYARLILFLSKNKWLPFDLNILKYEQGSLAPPHADLVQGYSHFRLNIVHWRSEIGGEFSCEHPIFVWWRVNFFRSDYIHSVSKIKKGSRYLLSIGFCVKNNLLNIF